MSWPHGSKGTCVPQCKLYGRCHHGCGGFTRKATKNCNTQGHRRGEPMLYIRGHQSPGKRWGKNGVPAKRLVPLLNWLVSVYGSQRIVATRLGIGACTISESLRGVRLMVRPDTARKITDLVLAHRRPQDPLRIFELDEPPRMPQPIRRTWEPRRGLFISGDRAKPVARRIIQHFGGLSPASRALADFYGLETLTAQRLLCRMQKGETRIRQGTLDHLEDFAEYIRTEIEAA